MKYLIQFTDDNFPYYCKSLTEFTAIESKARVFTSKTQANNYLNRIKQIRKLSAAKPKLVEIP